MILTAYLECILTDTPVVVDELHQLCHWFLAIHSLAKCRLSVCRISSEEVEAWRDEWNLLTCGCIVGFNLFFFRFQASKSVFQCCDYWFGRFQQSCLQHVRSLYCPANWGHGFQIPEAALVFIRHRAALRYGILQANVEQGHDAFGRVAVAVVWRCVCCNGEV